VHDYTEIGYLGGKVMKLALGIIVWVFLGFIVAMAGASVFHFAILFVMTQPWWLVVLETLVGMVMVGVYMWNKIKKEEDENEQL
tara:strand:+ start:30867 stop:31118 length:252 start_codon:yes stop_codon:yes gene_type:complete